MSSSRFVSTPGLRIAFVEHGDPSGEPVALLHGFPDAPAGFDPLLARLDQDSVARYRLIIAWLRGFGETIA